MKLLVVTSEPVDAEAVRAALGSDEELKQAEVLVIAPALQTSKVKFWMSDDDGSIEHAEEVQEEMVQRLDEEGVDAAGDTGEADPVMAIRDTLQTFQADRVVVFSHPEADASYGEENLGGQDFGVPVEYRQVARD